MQFEFIHYLLIVLIWVGVTNLCYMLLKSRDNKTPTKKVKPLKKKEDNSDEFYEEMFGGE